MKKLTTMNRRGKFLLPLPAKSRLHLNQQISLGHGGWWTVVGIDPDKKEVCLQRKVPINKGTGAFPSRKGSWFKIEEDTLSESEILETLEQAASKAVENQQTRAKAAAASPAPVKKKLDEDGLRNRVINRFRMAQLEASRGLVTSTLLPDGIRV
jgi:hypothetical protein